MDMDTDADKSQFFSLTWKAVILLSLVLVAVNATLAVLVYMQADRQFELAQQSNRTQQTRELSALLEHGYQTLSGFARFIPLLRSDRQLGEVSEAEQLFSMLEWQGALLDVEWGVRSVHYAEPGKPLTRHWPKNAGSDGLQELMEKSRTRERPENSLRCRPDCTQYVAVPLLSGGHLVLGQSLGELILKFRRLSGADIAVLGSPSPIPKGIEGEQRFLGAWGLEMPAVSNPAFIYPLLDAYSRSRDFAAASAGPGLFKYGGEWYELFLVNMADAEDISFMLVDRVTDRLDNIRRATRNSAMIGLLGLLVSESLLLFLLRTPMKRLRGLVRALPLLAENAFEQLRAELRYKHSGHFGRDEIDVLMASVDDLADRMDALSRKREDAERNLIRMADHDALTDLYNRRRFQAEFERVLEHAHRYQHSGALLYFDLDHFKYINDLSGHQTGDALLRLVSERLRTIVRATDVLARLGGDEFALLLPEAGAESAMTTATKLQETLQRLEMPVRGRTHRVSASIGITLFPDHGIDTRDLMSNADLAMYHAKEQGRGRWHLFSVDDHALELLDKRATWREKIERALKEDRFELHFQPILHTASGRIARHEVLLRLREPDGDLVYPDRFIPVAEHSGQIGAIDRWVTARAVELMIADEDLSLSVNLSGSVMSDPELYAWLKQLIGNEELCSGRLVFEVTETAAVENLAAAGRMMNDIRKLGCRFALDDFGTGFASYGHLKDLPVEYVKIDGSFIRNLSTSKDDELFVSAMVKVAKGLGKATVAEFVEDAETLEMLRGMGVDFAQGYYIGRPDKALKTV